MWHLLPFLKPTGVGTLTPAVGPHSVYSFLETTTTSRFTGLILMLGFETFDIGQVAYSEYITEYISLMIKMPVCEHLEEINVGP